MNKTGIDKNMAIEKNKMIDNKKEFKFPTEVVDLPSGGKLYPKDSPLSNGKLELKYMTAKEEDILTSQNLIKKGVVIDRLLDSLIVTKGIKSADFVIGDKNAVMVAARILAYGPDYSVEITDPNTDEKFEHTFNLTECEFEKLPKDVDKNEFEIELPVSKMPVIFKILTGKEEYLIEREIKSQQKLNKEVSDQDWDNFVYLRKSPRGKHLELWQHISGCRQWFKVQRDTVTHEIFKTAEISEDI